MCLTEVCVKDIRKEITSLFTYRRETTLTDAILVCNYLIEISNFVGHAKN
jgi:hypothetical protein